MKESTPDYPFTCSFARYGKNYAPDRTIDNPALQALVTELRRSLRLKFISVMEIDDKRIFADITEDGCVISRGAFEALLPHEVKWLIAHLVGHTVFPAVAETERYSVNPNAQETWCDAYACTALKKKGTDLGDLEAPDVGALVLTKTIGEDDENEVRRRIDRLFHPEKARRTFRAA